MDNGCGAGLRIGQRLGRYRIEALLGVGGMGLVYRAHDRMLQRTVAIKIPERTDSKARRWLLEEARAAASLSHPAICSVHAIGSDGDQAFIVMEHVKGAPLSTLIRPGSGLALDLVRRYVVQIVDAVAYAHSRGVVHCDLKSANIMIGQGGTVKLVDFGMAVRQPMAGDTDKVVADTTRAAIDRVREPCHTWRRSCCAAVRRARGQTSGRLACCCMKWCRATVHSPALAGTRSHPRS
jgi:serine/threonine protein kinase